MDSNVISHQDRTFYFLGPLILYLLLLSLMTQLGALRALNLFSVSLAVKLILLKL